MRRACYDVARREGIERHPHHLDAPLAHVDEAVDDVALRLQMARELRELGDGHALVAHPLDVDRRVQDREDEPEVGRDGGLPREHELDLALEALVAVVDLVVERDHLVAELDVLASERVHGAADRPRHDLADLLEAGLERVEIGLQLGSHPKRPVT